MFEKDKLIMPHLGILATTFCNLNCRRCADLIPKRQNMMYKFQDVISDMNRILDSVDYISEVLIIGGEILLYPKLIELINECSKESKIGKVIITTNGTIIPSNELINTFKKENVVVRISGYPKDIATNRKKVIDILSNENIEIENLEDMTWLDMGNTEYRNRSKKELTEIFSTCSMKDCVTLVKGGNLLFCSRQATALETDIYSKPLEHEYIRLNDCKNNKELKNKLVAFYNLNYISTCNYCDGISCATKRIVPTAIQIINKDEFFDLIIIYEKIDSLVDKDKIINEVIYLSRSISAINNKVLDVDGYFELIQCINDILLSYKNNTFDLSMKELLINNLFVFLNFIASDYNYKVKSNDDILSAMKKRNLKGNYSNVITIGDYEENSNCDLSVEAKDVIVAAKQHWPIDFFDYTRLYVMTKLRRLERSDIKCVISGLSYTQYGIIDELFQDKIINISVSGQDMYYQILMARKALQVNNNIKLFVIPFAYYHESYDMSSDDSLLHQNVVSRVNIPILKEKENYKGPKLSLYNEKPINPIYLQAFNLEKVRQTIENEYIEEFEKGSFFVKMDRPKTGGLKFNFNDLSVKERYESAKITAELNERVCTDNGRKIVNNSILHFLSDMNEKGIKVLFFAPPMTKYLYQSYSSSMKNRYYSFINYIKSIYSNIIFEDYSKVMLSDNYFCDYEHLNYEGGCKFSKILSNKIHEILYDM